MICEAQRQLHIGSLPKGVEGFVGINGINVNIERTACNLGGSRAWFLCPSCNRRCAILYPVKCRLCLGLHHASEHEGNLDRLLRKAIKHRAKHGQTQGGIVVPFPSKPKWMRWHTYFKARTQAQGFETQIAAQYRFKDIQET